MLSNAYLLAKFRFDTAENEQHFAEFLPKIDTSKLVDPGFQNTAQRRRAGAGRRARGFLRGGVRA